MISFMFTEDARNTGDQFYLTENPVASCRWHAEGSWPHCYSGKEEETEGGISTWHLGQGGRRLRGSDIWWVSSKGSSSFWPDAWLVCVRAWVLHKYDVSAKTSVCLLFPFPHPTLYFYVYVLPEFCHGVRVCHGVLSMRNLWPRMSGVRGYVVRCYLSPCLKNHLLGFLIPI